MQRWNLIWASQGRNAGNRLLPVLVLLASICRLLCTQSLLRSVRVNTVLVSVFVCLLPGARAHFEVPQHFLADTFYTRRAQNRILGLFFLCFATGAYWIWFGALNCALRARTFKKRLKTTRMLLLRSLSSLVYLLNWNVAKSVAYLWAHTVKKTTQEAITREIKRQRHTVKDDNENDDDGDDNGRQSARIRTVWMHDLY